MPKAHWPDVPDYGNFEPIPSDDYKNDVTKVEKKRVWILNGTKPERNGMKLLSRMEKKMGLILNGI